LKTLIVGAGGFAREVWTWMGEPECFFYSDYKEESDHIYNNEILNPLTIKSKVDEIDKFYVAIGDPQIRKQLTIKFVDFGLRLGEAIIVAPLYSTKNKVGLGSIICPGVVLTTNIEIGIGVIVNINSTVGHDVGIKDFSTISPGCFISGNVQIDESVFIGTGASIREKLKIGTNSVVGMGSIVVKDVESKSIVIGNPARSR
jgi:sugar O-acyltransferase (sialic acid O-acetyltransferase NeuD family)